VVVPAAVDAASASPSAADTARRPVQVVPKGLRSFDARDADFFLELLPGPRDRDGLPESIRSWKTRIEDPDPDPAFPAGLIYGPSGCGKSSLVKAGLLPRLAGHVVAVYVEATPAETEARLLRGVRKRCPGLPDHRGLVETLAGLRRGRGLPAGAKVLLVLDQFEQWLHAKRDEQHTELVQALRHCDGRHLQCLVLVRDDFWMAVTRFLRDLEIPLIEGQNSAAVDLFDPRHARKVLAAFGRAFGALPPGEPAPEQERFLDQVVAGLAQGNKVISVRLSLFAEMVKGRPWLPATLQEVGGTEGVGVAFLEETFSAATAPPEHRLHQKAARAVLQALLPEQGTDIRGHMRSYAELLDASGYARRPREFDDLRRILDSELRLVTPTDPEGLATEGTEDTERRGEEGKEARATEGSKPSFQPSSLLSVSSVPSVAPASASPRSQGQYYQLTHDYLVPALRQWLTRKQRETRRGRAELRLAERAALWTAKPENRHLPAWWEWANIRLFTRRPDWTPPQRRMMRQAARYHGWRGLALALLLTAATLGGFEIRRRVVADMNARAADGLVDRLRDAEVAQVPAIVAELAPYRAWADPRLAELLEQEQASPKERLHARLALLPVDAGQVEPLREALLRPDARPAEVLVVRDALLPHQGRLTTGLWEQLAAGEANRDRRFRAACALAAYEPDSPRWTELAPAVVEQLVAQDAVFLGGWLEALRPVRARLLEPLARVFRAPDQAAERSRATDILAEYAADQPDLLAELLKDADDQQYAKLWPKLLPYREQAVARMSQELTRTLPPEWKDAPLDAAWAAPDPALVRQVADAHGLLAERFAFCQTLPLDQFPALAERLRRCGYRPIQFRPYSSAERSGVASRCLLAAVWTRDGRDWQLAPGVTAEEIRKQDEAWRQKGYVPLDVASYVAAAGTDPEGELYAALWGKPDAEVAETQLYVGVPEGAPHTAAREELQKKGFVPRTQTWLTHAGQTRHSAVWWKPKQALDHPVSDFRYDELAYESTLTPSNLQGDVRLARAVEPPSSRQRDTELLAQAENDLKAKPDNLSALFQRAQARVRLGQDAKAVPDLAVLITKSPKFPGAYQYRALAHARAGRAAEAKADLAQFQKLSTNASTRAYLDAVVAAHLGEDAEGLKRLEEALARNAPEVGFLYNAACAYAVAAQVVTRRGEGEAAAAPPPERAKTYAERAVALLREAVANGYQNYRQMQTDPDLDAVRDHAGFQALLSEAHLERQYAAVWHASPVLESAESHGLDPAAHLARGRELAGQGYRPVALSVLALGSGQPPATASVWHRPVVPEADKDALARRQAQAAVALLRLGRDELVWPLWRHSSDPRVRTYLIHRLSPLGTDPRTLLRRLEEERDDSARRALLLCLGEFGEDRLPLPERQPVAAALLRTYRDDPDPGLHGAADWLLRRWGHAAELARIDQELASPQARGDRRWYVNGQGQTLVVIPGPVEFAMGSPGSEPGRIAINEPLHRKRIGRSFALAAKEVTVEQFLRFRSTHRYTNQYSPTPDGPIINVTWYDAAAYCNWLSEQEGIPEAEWCYPKKVAEGMVLPRAYLGKTGYRLPTEAEWEYACRAGAGTTRFYGVQDDRVLESYAWFLGNAQNRAWPVGQLKPNDLGLFDMYGNVYEWCQERALLYRWAARGRVNEDKEDVLDIRDNQSRLLRGGAFLFSASHVRSAIRGANRPSGGIYGAGFRVARTYR
jgi:formylglycine-generating enzyme required for sulfatase activity